MPEFESSDPAGVAFHLELELKRCCIPGLDDAVATCGVHLALVRVGGGGHNEVFVACLIAAQQRCSAYERAGVHTLVGDAHLLVHGGHGCALFSVFQALPAECDIGFRRCLRCLTADTNGRCDGVLPSQLANTAATIMPQ